MRTVLYLDDLRECPTDTGTEKYCCVRNYSDFVKWIEENGMPDLLDLDHDLGEEKTGYDCMKYVIETHILDKSSKLPKLRVHSANPVGSDNIREVYKNYLYFLAMEEIGGERRNGSK